MTKKYKKALFIFRRDLRLVDNTGFITACKLAETVVPAFIFDPRQILDHKYLSLPALGFMMESLEELNEALKSRGSRLYVFFGKAEEKATELLKNEGFDLLAVNKDYTPFSLKRDQLIEAACENQGVTFVSESDLLLQEPESITKGDGGPYSVFTHFYNRARQLEVRSVSGSSPTNLHAGSVKTAMSSFEEIRAKQPAAFRDRSSQLYKGGRKEALKRLRGLSKLSDCKLDRDFPAKDGTSRLSAHNKFGTCSIREVFHAVAIEFGKESELARQLYWRDFYSHIAFHFPHVFKGSFKPKFDSLEWKSGAAEFKLWCEGKTGFPIVDAGMRELNTSGYLHNRVRLIVASFLIKDLGINWQEGEKYFARTLSDYDPAVNNGNWQWVASTGCDAQPFFRVFNPWLQQKKFDPDCAYIKKWVPELRELSASAIHKLAEKRPEGLDYPVPVVDHQEAKEETLARYYDVN